MLPALGFVRFATTLTLQFSLPTERTLDTLSPAAATELRADLGLVNQAVRAGVVPGRAAAADRHWQQWLAFAASVNVDPWLHSVLDPIPLLQVFAARYRDGRLAPSHGPVRSRTVEDAVRSVGQTFARVGAKDVRKDALGGIDFRLQRQLRAYAKADPAPARVKPIPIQLLFYALSAAHAAPHADAMLAIADMAVIAFYFLLRPGEYTGASADNTPFTLADVQLFLGARRLDLFTAPPADLRAATAVSLTFTTQKSGVRGEVVQHGRSGSAHCCPTRAVARRVLHLRHHVASPTTPLGTYYAPSAPGGPVRRHPVTSADITGLLRTAAQALGPELGLLPCDIQARSLRAGGAMALLCAKVDSNIIRLLGRWQSDVMMRYLHLQAQPIMNEFASRMLRGGNYVLAPGLNIPTHL